MFILFICFGVTSAINAFSDGDIGEAIKSSINMKDEDEGLGVDDFPFFHEVWSCGDEEKGAAKVVRIPLRVAIFF